MPIECPVLIAGGGPVGVTLAMDLASRGIRAIVLEARETVPPNPRCNTTNARSMEIFRRLGCADQVRAAGLPGDHSTDVLYMTAMNGAELVRYARATPDQVRAGTAAGVGSNWPTAEPQHFISQLYMEPVLRDWAVEHHHVDLWLGWELVDFTADAEGVVATARKLGSDRTATIRAAYLVGADGAGSIVRRLIGARLTGVPDLGSTCSVFLHARRLTELYQAHPGWMYRFIGGGAVVVAIDGDDEWLVHTMPRPGQDVESFAFEPAMFDAIGEAFDYEVINVTRWTSRAMVANKYREGRVFLAGDAAHIWIPMGGFGMNAGIGDAVSLGWLLAGVLQGWLDPRALDAHEAERAPIGGLVAAQAARWGTELRPLMLQAPAARAELAVSETARKDLGDRIRAVNTSEWESVGLQLGISYAESPIIAYDGTAAPAFALSDYRESSSPGARAPHLWRASGASLHDQFGIGFTLLRLGAAPPAASRLIAAASARGVPLTVLDVPEPAAVAKYDDVALVLVRPDQHIAWRGQQDPDDADDVLDRITGRLIPRPEIARPPVRRAGQAPVSAAGMVTTRDGNFLLYADGGGIIRHCRVTPEGGLGQASLFIILPGAPDIGGLAVDDADALYICLPAQRRVACFDTKGRHTADFDTPGRPSVCAVRGKRLLIACDDGTVVTADIAGPI